MAIITCSRCKQQRDQMAFRPFRNDLGERLYGEICAVCWGEWLKYQQQLINHSALNLQDPLAKQFLYDHIGKFLFTTEPQA